MIGGARVRLGALVGLALVAARVLAPASADPPARTPEGYRLANTPYAFTFPRDHAAHPDYRTEWWYYTGHLRAGARRFGYELTFFRVGLDPARRRSLSAWAPHTLVLAHLALTDETGRRFEFRERAAREALGLAGADSARYRVWIDDWSAELAADGRTHRLRAAVPEFALALDLEPQKPPVVHGANGVSAKGVGASHYYSLTRNATRGALVVHGDTLGVEGSSWMDHEFMTDALGPGQVGWDWFGLQLDDGRELMLYRLRRRDGTVEPRSSGTLIERDGRAVHLPLSAFTVDSTARWRSERSGGVYPAGWVVRVRGRDLELRLEPTVPDQELRTPGSTGTTYWEGSVRIRGRSGRKVVTGEGYVELTGYAGPPPES